jgi:PmbA protein
MEPRMLLSKLVDLARKQGAQAAEALYESSDELGITWQRGSASLPTQRRHCSASVGVYLSEGRVAWCSFDETEPHLLLAQAEERLRAALDRAHQAQPNAHAGPVERYDIVERGLGLLDRRQEKLSVEDRREVLEDNAQGCKQVHPDIRVERLEYREWLTQRAYASSRGHSATEHSSRFEATLQARLGRNGRRHIERVASRQFANVASIPFGAELGKRMATLAAPTTLPGEEQPVIMDATCTAHLLRSLAPAFTVSAVEQGSSFMADCFGTRVAASKFHLIDDPSLPGALLSRAFDDRGVPPAPVVLLREGVASGLYLDPASARQRDLRPSGHIIQGRLVPSNLVLRPGNRSRNAIGMDLNHYLVIDNLHEAQPINLATGEVDTLCDLLVYRDHDFQGAVEGVHLSLTVRDLLNAVVEIASDQARYAEVDACSLVFEGIRFSI